MQNMQRNNKTALKLAWVLLFACMAAALLFFCSGAIGSSAVPSDSIFL